jgi:hypothetical protein
MKKIYTALEIRMISGIQVDTRYSYILKLLTLNDIDTSGYTDEIIKTMSKIPKVEDMVNHLKLRGTLPAIILHTDGRTIMDGQHRVAAYIINGQANFYGLIKTL